MRCQDPGPGVLPYVDRGTVPACCVDSVSCGDCVGLTAYGAIKNVLPSKDKQLKATLASKLHYASACSCVAVYFRPQIPQIPAPSWISTAALQSHLSTPQPA